VEGKVNYLYRMNADGSGRTKVASSPILEFFDISPDARWAAVAVEMRDAPAILAAISLVNHDPPVPICATFCQPSWTADGKTLSVIDYPMSGTMTFVLPVSQRSGLPELPRLGLSGPASIAGVRDAKVLAGSVVLGPTGGISATEREEVHRNLYRIPLQ
jgi:hypothetical protein